LEAFEFEAEEASLVDLRQRLAVARYPLDVGNDDWRYGANRAYLEDLVQYWRSEFDWRAAERTINSLPNFRTVIGGVPIHFVHARGQGPKPMPLILTHGYPWTFMDFAAVIGPLREPGAFGGDPADSFDVVVPSLPGHVFSAPLERTGVNFVTTAELWIELMRALGYERFSVGGGDWGALVSSQLGHRHADLIYGVHLTLTLPLALFDTRLPGRTAYAPEELHLFEQTRRKMDDASSHAAPQARHPQTLAYLMNDSPLGLAAWIVEKRRSWSDCGGNVESRYGKDALLTNVMLYWLTETIGSTMRFYWEARRNPWRPSHPRVPVVEAPTAVAAFPADVALMPRAWIEKYYNLHQYTMMPAGGHFGPAEEPQLFVEDMRRFYRPLREQM
jgi:pimeloyl-ACP methyl ester carboxylesterase